MPTGADERDKVSVALYRYVGDVNGTVDVFGLASGDPLPDDVIVNRIGGNSVSNLSLKDAEKALSPPGISTLHSVSPGQAKDQMVGAFPRATRLHELASTVGSTTAKDIRDAGFDVIEDPTRKFPNHARIIHPEGAEKFTGENLSELSKKIENVDCSS